MQQQREAWRAEQGDFEVAQLVFLDEFSVTTDMTPRYGRAAAGERVHDAVPAGHYCQTSVIASMRLGGAGAAMSVAGAVDGEAFEAYVREHLAPTLKRGDVVVMDNLSVHKSPDAVEAIEAVGAEVRYLPPYSPDLNPIEKMFAKVKQMLRKAKARTASRLNEALGEALSAVRAADAAAYFTSSGYPANA